VATDGGQTLVGLRCEGGATGLDSGGTDPKQCHARCRARCTDPTAYQNVSRDVIHFAVSCLGSETLPRTPVQPFASSRNRNLHEASQEFRANFRRAWSKVCRSFYVVGAGSDCVGTNRYKYMSFISDIGITMRGNSSHTLLWRTKLDSTRSSPTNHALGRENSRECSGGNLIAAGEYDPPSPVQTDPSPTDAIPNLRNAVAAVAASPSLSKNAALPAAAVNSNLSYLHDQHLDLRNRHTSSDVVRCWATHPPTGHP